MRGQRRLIQFSESMVEEKQDLKVKRISDYSDFEIKLTLELKKKMTYLEAGFLGSSASKESTCNVGDLGLISGLGSSPGGGHDNLLQYSCLENPQGQRNLAG